MEYAAAEASYGDAEYVFVGVPLEATTSFRKGTGFAPQRVREMSHGTESYHPGADVDVADLDVHDYGDVDVWQDAEESVDYVEGVVSDVVDDGKTPVLVGGEHTVSVAGARAVDADGFVVFDAHLDLKDEFEGEDFSHACVSRRLHEENVDVVVVGGRSGSREEYGYAESSGVTVIPPCEFSVERVETLDTGMERPYVSVDLDVLAPAYAPDVGTPEAFGLTPRDVGDALQRLSASAAGFDVVEARPSGEDESSMYAAAFVKEYLAWSSTA